MSYFVQSYNIGIIAGQSIQWFSDHGGGNWVEPKPWKNSFETCVQKHKKIKKLEFTYKHKLAKKTKNKKQKTKIDHFAILKGVVIANPCDLRTQAV